MHGHGYLHAGGHRHRLCRKPASHGWLFAHAGRCRLGLHPEPCGGGDECGAERQRLRRAADSDERGRTDLTGDVVRLGGAKHHDDLPQRRQPGADTRQPDAGRAAQRVIERLHQHRRGCELQRRHLRGDKRRRTLSESGRHSLQQRSWRHRHDDHVDHLHRCAALEHHEPRLRQRGRQYAVHTEPHSLQRRQYCLQLGEHRGNRQHASGLCLQSERLLERRARRRKLQRTGDLYADRPSGLRWKQPLRDRCFLCGH